MPFTANMSRSKSTEMFVSHNTAFSARLVELLSGASWNARKASEAKSAWQSPFADSSEDAIVRTQRTALAVVRVDPIMIADYVNWWMREWNGMNLM